MAFRCGRVQKFVIYLAAQATVAVKSDRGGCSSGVERQLPKLNVVSSNLITRSKPLAGNCGDHPSMERKSSSWMSSMGFFIDVTDASPNASPSVRVLSR